MDGHMREPLRADTAGARGGHYIDTDPDPPLFNGGNHQRGGFVNAAVPAAGQGEVLQQCTLIDPSDLMPSPETQEALKTHASNLGHASLEMGKAGYELSKEGLEVLKPHAAQLASKVGDASVQIGKAGVELGKEGLVYATHYGKEGLVFATHYGKEGFVVIRDYIQQGPRSISTLCLAGGFGTSIVGALHIAGFVGGKPSLFGYVLNVYMVLFGIATVVLETDADHMPMMEPVQGLAPHLLRAQSWLHEKVQFLTEFHGRALFYIYQGTLLMTQGCTVCLLFTVGLYNMFMGTLCLGMAYEYAKRSTPSEYEAMGETRACDVETGAEEAAAVEQPHDGQAMIYQHHQQVEQEFLVAKEAYEQHKKTIKGRAQFELYGLLQQAQSGDCTSKRPTGFLNSSAKAQWDAWNRLRGSDEYGVKAAFIERLQRAGISF
eukprot:gnl/TRDRNA2_/TRDRNA2_185817_c0_seq1.p1 gnl/TRDRNA2_/TRDRNA2_185817_c0~~gnl/TRDRNA2_/TRDRNA2_185817_c0_seq1.p1  ORF type:complete len:433 (-),score=88.02 gnl/TRDRNA2_/TRDRNA2_185817_c0_seq1:326-1624(-)